MHKRFLSFFCLLLFSCCAVRSVEWNPSLRQQIVLLDKQKPQDCRQVKPIGKVFVINVDDQREFDSINERITEAIKAGQKNIKVKIGKGVYFFHENHILRENEQLGDVFLTLEGEKAVVTADEDYGKEYYPMIPWSEVMHADALIEIVDTVSKLCFIPYKNNIDESKCDDITKVRITQWYKAQVYEVKRITKDGIYFVDSNLKFSSNLRNKGYSVNYDYLYMGKIPRFCLYDKSKEPDNNNKAVTFLFLQNCSYRSFEISGLCFSGNKSGASLMMLREVKADQIRVHQCTFNYIRGDVAMFVGTGNVVFDNNEVQNVESHGLIFTNNCRNVRVTHNLFENIGQSLQQTFCVNCVEAEYYIADNRFRDFSYAAIGIGVWYGQTKLFKSEGIVEHNEISYSPYYLSNKDKHTLMDSGAIYVFTQNDQVIIRYNYIHDYEGEGDNRGIFCDDGAFNLKIYGNVILNTPNSYSIDSRYVKDQLSDLNNNANNFMAYNIVDNRVRFMGYVGEERHNIKGANFIIKTKETSNLKGIFENLEVVEEDFTLLTANYKNRTLTLPKTHKKTFEMLFQDAYVKSIIDSAMN